MTLMNTVNCFITVCKRMTVMKMLYSFLLFTIIIN